MGTHIFPGRGPCLQVPLPEAPYKVDGFLAAVFERHSSIHTGIEGTSYIPLVRSIGLLSPGTQYWALEYLITDASEFAITSGPW